MAQQDTMVRRALALGVRIALGKGAAVYPHGHDPGSGTVAGFRGVIGPGDSPKPRRSIGRRPLAPQPRPGPPNRKVCDGAIPAPSNSSALQNQKLHHEPSSAKTPHSDEDAPDREAPPISPTPAGSTGDQQRATSGARERSSTRLNRVE